MAAPLILLPGLLCDGRLWQGVAEALGSPIQSPDLSQDDTLGAMAERVLAEAPPLFALGGHSMGGYLALEILRRAPERVECLALICTKAGADPEAQRQRRQDAIALARSGRFGQVVAAQIGALFTAESGQDPVLTGLFRAMAEAIGPEGFARQQQAIMGRPDSTPMLAGIRCPTLVVGGALDGMTPPALQQELAAAIPGAAVEIVPEAGHLAPLERPGAVAAVLRPWLAGLPPRAPLGG
mgnify:CR=1 FL=1